MQQPVHITTTRNSIAFILIATVSPDKGIPDRSGYLRRFPPGYHQFSPYGSFDCMSGGTAGFVTA
jgi:hypothetical protein